MNATPETPKIGPSESIERILDGIAQAFAQFREAFNVWQPALRQFVESIAALPEATRNALVILGERGWYVDPELPAGFLLAAATAIVDDLEGTTKDLCRITDERAAEAESTLCEAFPQRARIIGQAFAAHRSKTYALSIPVFLAQADGICQELHGVQIYSKDRSTHEPALKRKVEEVDLDRLTTLLLTPLLTDMPLTASPRRRATATVRFNRHAILHGEAVDYDTFENSCRAISFLSYSAWALRLVKSRPE